MCSSVLASRPRHRLYRTTFVRGHVGPQLTAADEVLAVKLLAGDLGRELGRGLTVAERALLLDEFFGREEPERRLYLPLALQPHPADADQPALPREYLTCLTEYLARPPRGAPGVLLAARSGAGKTAAGVKAFRDCVVSARGADRPPLADRLPVRLRLSGLSAVAATLANLRSTADAKPDAARRWAGQVDSPIIVEELLLDAAGLDAPPEVLRQWLRHGPPLLLFLDLNTAESDAVRLAAARSLRRFQEEYAPLGCRCVVAYRSTEAGDAAVSALRERRQFRTFDLAPVDADAAVAYLRHLRRFEADAYLHFDRTPPRRDVERECRTLEEFVRRHAANRESLISTPLIMELVATLRPGDVEAIRSLSDLYERVTAALLVRQGMDSEGDQDRATAAMVRLALAIVARGPTATRLDGRRSFLNLLEHPEYGRRGEHPWHPAGRFWHGSADVPCPYYSGAIQPAQRYRERTLLAERDGAVCFLHDSFVYHFAACALRYHDGRERPPAEVGVDPDVWPREAAARIVSQLASWEQPLEFLGGMLSAEQIRALTASLLTAEPHPELARALARLLRGRRSREQERDDPVLRQMERAVRSRLTEVERYPEALFPHVYNHLSWCEEPPAACRVFAEGVLWPAMNATGRPWLRAETPMPPLREQVFRCDSDIYCIAVSGPGEFVTGHKDGTVRRWRVDRGDYQILYKHEGVVRCVAVDGRDGAVLSGGDDKTLRRLGPGAGKAEVLYRHNDAVWCVAVDGRDGAVLSGGNDKAVRRLGPGDARHGALPPRGPRPLRGGGRPGRNCDFGGKRRNGAACWREGEPTRPCLYRHRRSVRCVAVDGRDGAVLSAGDEGAVRRLPPGGGDAEILYRHESVIRCVAVDGAGRFGAVGRNRLDGAPLAAGGRTRPRSCTATRAGVLSLRRWMAGTARCCRGETTRRCGAWRRARARRRSCTAMRTRSGAWWWTAGTGRCCLVGAMGPFAAWRRAGARQRSYTAMRTGFGAWRWTAGTARSCRGRRRDGALLGAGRGQGGGPVPP